MVYAVYGMVCTVYTQYNDAVEHAAINLFFAITRGMSIYQGKKLLRIQRAIKCIDFNTLWDNKIFNGFLERFICILYTKNNHNKKRQFPITLREQFNRMNIINHIHIGT